MVRAHGKRGPSTRPMLALLMLIVAMGEGGVPGLGYVDDDAGDRLSAICTPSV